MTDSVSIKCNRCNETFNATPYFYDESIYKTSDILSFAEEYEASVRARAICPYCGETCIKFYKYPISRSSIIKLAIGNKE